MTYTVDEAKDIADAVKASGRVLQVGSQYTSMDHFHKARKAIADGLIGRGDVGRRAGSGATATSAASGTTRSIPKRPPKTLDWKAFLGSAPKRPFEPERYFRWRKYWDYSGGIATDLFYHSVSPLLLTVGGEFPARVTASGGIYMQKDREVPDTFFMNVDYPAWTMQLACSVGSGVGAPLVVHGSEATLFIAQDSEALANRQMEVVPDAEYREEFKKKTGAETLKIDVQPRRARLSSAHGQLPRVRPVATAAESSRAARLPGNGGDRHGRAGLPAGRGPVLRSHTGSKVTNKPVTT